MAADRAGRTEIGEQRALQLLGPSSALDPRTTPARGDLADIALAGRVFVPHYVAPQDSSCAAPAAAIRARPDAQAPAVSELIHGERFAVLDRAGGWAWGYSRHDGYCGHVREDALGAPVATTHAVTVPAALVFAEPDIKSPVLARLPMGARLAASVHADGRFVALAGGGFVSHRHAERAGAVAADFVVLAERMLGAPYLWGGRSGDGCDCSGLVQTALGLAGIAAPRDTDQQATALGDPLPPGEPLRRGDLIFFPGHVGIMADGERLLHANAHWMQVTVEPLADVLARFDQAQHAITGRRRLA